jgi:DNA repair photolyase
VRPMQSRLMRLKNENHINPARLTEVTMENRSHAYGLKAGISRTPEFEKKMLACFAVNCGVKCGHNCLYCSTGAILRMHSAFKACGENPFGFGYSIVDTDTPARVAEDAKRVRQRGLVQLCTTVDAWAPEAQEHQLGRRCLQAILAEPGWSVRVLTKNGAVMEDYDLIEAHRDRVLVGLSLTATPAKADLIRTVEPNTSSILVRTYAMKEAAARGLRTYAMLCPLLPGIADSPDDVDELVRFAVEVRAEEIFVEPVNPRAAGLRLCQEALVTHGRGEAAAEVGRIRKRANWSQYVVDLVTSVQRSVRKHSDISKLRFLLYPSNLLPEDVEMINTDDAGVIWLGKSASKRPDSGARSNPGGEP